MVAVLAGGTGGAKLARGLLEEVGDGLRVIANTADDAEIYGVHVSPDPDLVTYWLADEIDERGYGLRGDSWEVMRALERGGREAWFRLGDRDLAMCLLRTERLRAGDRLTDAHSLVTSALGVSAGVLPMADEPVRTQVKSSGHWRAFQEFMIREPDSAPVEGIELKGIESARPTPEVIEALSGAEAIVIGPSNPVISIGPILAVPEMREALASSSAPVVAVSPFVGGHALKGPTERFFAHAGLPVSAAGIARTYAGVIDGLVTDEQGAATDGRAQETPVLVTDTLMDDADSRRRVAQVTLAFAASLAG